MKTLEARPTRDYLLAQLLLCELDLMALERLLGRQGTTPHLANELDEQVEGLRAAKEKLLAELGEP